MHVSLFQPQIPGNTGNIGRMCVGLNTHLHIIGPCAFDFGTKALRRAGLDYWQHLTWTLHPGPEDFLAWLAGRQPWLITKFGRARFDQAPFETDDVLIFGNEVRGLPDSWHERWPQRGVYVPILGPIRSYNLANSAAIVLAQAQLRSGAFPAAGSPVPNPGLASGSPPV